MNRYDKLVRDRIPEIIVAGGREPVTRVLNDAEYLAALHRKLDEELQELHEAGSLEEMADLLEVLLALCEASGHTREALETARAAKAEARGRFRERIYLIETRL